MMTLPRKRWIEGLVLAFGLALLVLFAVEKYTQHQVRPTGELDPGIARGVSESMDASPMGGVGPPSETSAYSVFGDMARAARNAQDFRSFVHNAQQQAEHGGIFYAHAVLQQCALFSDSFGSTIDALDKQVTKNMYLSPARLQALGKLRSSREKCAAFTPEELQRAPALYALGIGTDPLIMLSEELRNHDRKSAEGKRALLESVLAVRDPTLFSAVFDLVSVKLPNQEERVVLLDGRPFGGISRKHFFEAASLLSCDFGESCDLANPNVLAVCAHTGICASDLLDMYRRANARNPQAFDSIWRTYLRLRDVFATRDGGGFAANFQGTNPGSATGQANLAGSSIPPL